jgi:hypothetical protein
MSPNLFWGLEGDGEGHATQQGGLVGEQAFE